MYLVSWNYRHLVNVRRREEFHQVSVMNGYYKPLQIVTPPEVSNVASKMMEEVWRWKDEVASETEEMTVAGTDRLLQSDGAAIRREDRRRKIESAAAD